MCFKYMHLPSERRTDVLHQNLVGSRIYIYIYISDSGCCNAVILLLTLCKLEATYPDDNIITIVACLNVHNIIGSVVM